MFFSKVRRGTYSLKYLMALDYHRKKKFLRFLLEIPQDLKHQRLIPCKRGPVKLNWGIETAPWASLLLIRVSLPSYKYGFPAD
jgi:hypothetical protein